MDDKRFDHLARVFAISAIRRSALKGFLGVVLAGFTQGWVRSSQVRAYDTGPVNQCVTCTNEPCPTNDCFTDPCYECQEDLPACPPLTFFSTPVEICPCEMCQSGNQEVCYVWTGDRYRYNACPTFLQGGGPRPVESSGGAESTSTPANAVPSTDTMVQATVTKVLSGDTIRVDVGRSITVRLLGIDAPNSNSKDGDECYSKEATAHLAELVQGTSVWLDGETSADTDTRWNRYVWLQDDFDLTLVNEILARDGDARAKRSALDGRYDARLTTAAHAAKAEGAGLWGACGEKGSADSGSGVVCNGKRTAAFFDPFGWGICYDPNQWQVRVAQSNDRDHFAQFVAGEVAVTFHAYPVENLIAVCPEPFTDGLPDGVIDEGLYEDPSGAPSISEPGAEVSYTVRVLRSASESVHYASCRLLPTDSTIEVTCVQVAGMDAYPDAAELREDLLVGMFFGDPPSGAGGLAEPTPTSLPSGESPLDADYSVEQLKNINMEETIHTALSRREVADGMGGAAELYDLLKTWGWSSNLFAHLIGNGVYGLEVVEVNIDRFADVAAAFDWFADSLSHSMTETDIATFSARPHGATGFVWYDLGDAFHLYLGDPTLIDSPAGTRQATLLLRHNDDVMRVSGVSIDMTDGETLALGVNFIAWRLTQPETSADSGRVLRA